MITRENYEAFYLDFLEGTLSKEMEKAFLAFLDANPDLQISDDELPILEEEEISLTEFDKLLLKKHEETITPITKENIEYFLVSQLEGTLSENQKTELTNWLNLHPEYMKDKALYAKTVLPIENISYLNKGELYQDAKVIPLWARVSSIAASVILMIGIGSYFTFKSVEVDGVGLPQFSQNDTVPVKDKMNNPAKNVSGVAPYAQAPIFATQNDKKDNVDKENIGQDQNLANNAVEQPNKDPKDHKDSEDNNQITNKNGGILPDQPDLATHVTEKTNAQEHEANNDYAFGLTENPIEPITNELSKRLNTVIDFRRAKENDDQSGFYIKIGKFEFLHKKGGKH